MPKQTQTFLARVYDLAGDPSKAIRFGYIEATDKQQARTKAYNRWNDKIEELGQDAAVTIQTQNHLDEEIV
jgi:hypothetical protein